MLTVLDHPNLAYFGVDNSDLVLGHIGTTWPEILTISRALGKPIADLGSSRSPFILEGFAHGVDGYAIDQSYTKKTTVEIALFTMAKEFEKMRATFPALMQEEVWELLKPGLFEELRKKMVAAEVSDLRFQDEQKIPARYFSMVFAHDSIPKHSRNPEFFLQHELPEMLRVTDARLYIYPLITTKVENFGRSDEQLVPYAFYAPSSELGRKIQAVAAAAGFTTKFFLSKKTEDASFFSAQFERIFSLPEFSA